MKSKVIFGIIYAALAIVSSAFTPYTSTGTFDNADSISDWDSFNWEWPGYSDQKVDVTFDGQYSTNGQVSFRLAYPKRGDYYLTINSGIISAVDDDTFRYYADVSRTNIPPARTYYGEFLYSESGYTRSLAKGLVDIQWSLYQGTNAATFTTVDINYLITNNITIEGLSNYVAKIGDEMTGDLVMSNDAAITFRDGGRIEGLNYTGTGTTNVYIDSAGNLGVKTSTLTKELTVNGDVQANYYYGDGTHLTNVSVLETGFYASVASDIDGADTSKWHTAYSWGDHSTNGYAESTEVHSVSNALRVDLDALGVVASNRATTNAVSALSNLVDAVKATQDVIYAWGNYATNGYATESYVTNETYSVQTGLTATIQSVSNALHIVDTNLQYQINTLASTGTVGGLTLRVENIENNTSKWNTASTDASFATNWIATNSVVTPALNSVLSQGNTSTNFIEVLRLESDTLRASDAGDSITIETEKGAVFTGDIFIKTPTNNGQIYITSEYDDVNIKGDNIWMTGTVHAGISGSLTGTWSGATGYYTRAEADAMFSTSGSIYVESDPHFTNWLDTGTFVSAESDPIWTNAYAQGLDLSTMTNAPTEWTAQAVALGTNVGTGLLGLGTTSDVLRIDSSVVLTNETDPAFTNWLATNTYIQTEVDPDSLHIDGDNYMLGTVNIGTNGGESFGISFSSGGTSSTRNVLSSTNGVLSYDGYVIVSNATAGFELSGDVTGPVGSNTLGSSVVKLENVDVDSLAGDFLRSGGTNRFSKLIVADEDQTGSEILLNGDFSSGETNWLFGGDAYIAGERAQVVSGLSGLLTYTNYNIISNAYYKLSFYKGGTNGSAVAYLGNDSYSPEDSAFGSLTHFFESDGVGSQLTFSITANSDPSAYQYIDNVSLTRVTNGELRVIGDLRVDGTIYGLGGGTGGGNPIDGRAATNNVDMDGYSITNLNSIVSEEDTPLIIATRGSDYNPDSSGASNADIWIAPGYNGVNDSKLVVSLSASDFYVISEDPEAFGVYFQLPTSVGTSETNQLYRVGDEVRISGYDPVSSRDTVVEFKGSSAINWDSSTMTYGTNDGETCWYAAANGTNYTSPYTVMMYNGDFTPAMIRCKQDSAGDKEFFLIASTNFGDSWDFSSYATVTNIGTNFGNYYVGFDELDIPSGPQNVTFYWGWNTNGNVTGNFYWSSASIRGEL